MDLVVLFFPVKKSDAMVKIYLALKAELGKNQLVVLPNGFRQNYPKDMRNQAGQPTHRRLEMLAYR